MRFLEAQAILAKVASSLPCQTEIVPLGEALGRVSGAAFSSQRQVPPFANSSMDGFAVKALLSRAGARFRVRGTIFPGDLPFDAPAASGAASPEAWEITTGAPMPRDCDAVVKIEDVDVERDQDGHAIAFRFPQASSSSPSEVLKIGQNVRASGEDYRVGYPVITAGVVLGPMHLMALATVNAAQVEVVRRPRIVLLPTGRELHEPGAEIPAGGIVNSSKTYLLSAWKELGVDVIPAPILRDDPEAFLDFLKALVLDPPDVLVTTGAVSVGPADFVRQGLEQIGAQILFHRVQIRPGKPILFAQVPGSRAARPFVIFGLPGNPISTVVGHQFFVEPYLRRLMGLSPRDLAWARLERGLTKPSELRCFFRARVGLNSQGLHATVLGEQGSSLVRPLVEANAWAILPEGREQIGQDESIEILPFPSVASVFSQFLEEASCLS